MKLYHKLVLVWIIMMMTATFLIAATIDDIEFYPKQTLQAVDGHSVTVAIDKTDNNTPHVIWVYNGDLKHAYRLSNGSWSGVETIDDNGAFVFGADEHGGAMENEGTYCDENGTIHLVYTTMNGNVYYIYGTTGNWSDPELVNNTDYSKNYLDIAKFGDKLVVVWEDGVYDKIYYVMKDNGSWSSPVFMHSGEFCKLLVSDSGYLYYMGRGAIEPRDVQFAYIAPGGSSWTFVNGATDAGGHLGAGPGITSFNGTLYIAWSQKNAGIWNDTWKESSVFCATAAEPGASWDTRLSGTSNDTLMYCNTSSPNPRVGVFADGTVLVYNSRRDNEQIKLWNGTSWSDSLDAPWNDGTSDVAQAGMELWVAHQSYDNGAITVTGVKNNAVLEVQAPTISSADVINTTNLRLTFTEITEANSYHVYRGTSPDFVPDTQNGSNRVATSINDQSGGLPGVQWIDTDNVVGNASVNYFYAVTAVNSIQSDPSNIYGEFDYSLETTVTTSFNEIAMSLDPGTISNADDLLNAIPNCNSVAYWDASSQGYEQYINGIQITNFDVYAGYPYYVSVSQAGTYTLTGSPTDPTYSLISTATTDFNDIMLPFDQSAISDANDLQNSINSCTSVARWVAAQQGYQQYIPGVSITNFNVYPGYPYYVNVESNSTWPQGPIAKNTIRPASGKVARNHNLSVPHSVYGKLGGLETRPVHFEAQIIGTEHILTEVDAGNKLTSEVFVIQTAHFKNGWSIGDEVQIRFLDENREQIGSTTIQLSNAPFDQIAEITNDNDQLPDQYRLTQNYPNPFNPETVISYNLPVAGKTSLFIYNTMGQQIRTLVDGNKAPGSYQVVWDGRDDAGLNVPSGMYFYTLKSGSFTKQLKAVLIR